MLSNKLTFSLVLVLMLAFAITSVYAQDIVGEVAKDGFVVLGRTATTPGAGTTVASASLPVDLDFQLRSGDTIELHLEFIGDSRKADAEAAAKGASADATDDEKKKSMWHKVVISEIMWALDMPPDNAGEEDAAQWIEIYNNVGAIIGGTDADTNARRRLRIQYIDGASSNSPDTAILEDQGNTDAADDVYWVVVDRVRAVDSNGSAWELPGQNGNTAITDGDDRDADVLTDLVSMYRVINIKEGKYEVKDGALQGLGDGTASGSWAASVGSTATARYYVGTPGTYHRSAGGVIASSVFTKTPGSLSATGVIINEVRNDPSEANLDWVELYHNNDADDAIAQNVENWTLSIVTATKNDDGTYKDWKDDNLFSLPKYKLQPDTYLVIYNRDPGETILAGGVDIEDVAAGAHVNKGASHMYFVADGLDLPSDKMFTLILRDNHEKKGTHEKIVDFAGNGFFPRNETDKFNTNFWPLIAWPTPAAEGIGDNSFTSAGAYGRITALNDKGVYRPMSRADDRFHGDDWKDFGFVGAGYDRDVDPNSAPGTPGYANVAINIISDDRDNEKDKTAYAFGGNITISEVMYDARHPRDLVQWIELYNDSSDMAVDLSGWRVEIRNIADGKVESYVDTGFDFADHTKILPNQTLLLVSRTGPSSVPRTRVYDLNQRHRKELGLQRRDKVLLSSEGFYIELQAKVMVGGEEEMMMVDTAGNLMVDGATRTKQWDLPPADDEGARTSIVRQYDAGAAADGSMEDSWKVSDFAGLAYYGHRDDTGTPGYRRGGPLPVSLSSFRPVRNQTTGHVDIRWITESELNNAGFNILRAEGKDGEFTVINLQGIIAGHGTTSEKHVYTFTDKTAKPNVVYYYQIEDVSLNGNRTTLATTHMRGNVSAAGKVTTTWGDLKLQK